MLTNSTNQRQLSIRPAAVAGRFYPKNASQLNQQLDIYLSNSDVDIIPPKAIIAPLDPLEPDEPLEPELPDEPEEPLVPLVPLVPAVPAAGSQPPDVYL